MQPPKYRIVQSLQVLGIVFLLALIVDLFLLRYVYLTSPIDSNVLVWNANYVSIFWTLRIINLKGTHDNPFYKGAIIAKSGTFVFLMLLPIYLGVTNGLASSNQVKSRKLTLSLVFNLLTILFYVVYTGFEMLYIDYTTLYQIDIESLFFLIFLSMLYIIFQFSIYHLSKPDGKQVIETSDHSGDLYPETSESSDKGLFSFKKAMGISSRLLVVVLLILFSLVIASLIIPFSPLSVEDVFFYIFYYFFSWI